jgi:hypothetical protein
MSISLSSSTTTHLLCSRFSIGSMLTVGNLPCRRCAVPTGPTLPYASLCRHRARIERIPLVACGTSFTMPSSSKLAVSGELKDFPLSESDFSKIRQPGFAYFDKTGYIPVLENGSAVQLVCRPRGFGKSLTVSMLRYFHGFQFCNRYDELFKVCEVLSGQDLHARITYTKVRVSTWIRLSEMA